MISSRSRYALRALSDLASQDPGVPVLVAEIAHRQNIPVKFLQQIMLDLKQAQIVASRKGPGGGYMLARTQEQVTLADIFNAVDAESAGLSCTSNVLGCDCPHPEKCAIQEALARTSSLIMSAMQKTTLGDLHQRQGELDLKSTDMLDFMI